MHAGGTSDRRPLLHAPAPRVAVFPELGRHGPEGVVVGGEHLAVRIVDEQDDVAVEECFARDPRQGLAERRRIGRRLDPGQLPHPRIGELVGDVAEDGLDPRGALVGDDRLFGQQRFRGPRAHRCRTLDAEPDAQAARDDDEGQWDPGAEAHRSRAGVTSWPIAWDAGVRRHRGSPYARASFMIITFQARTTARAIA